MCKWNSTAQNRVVQGQLYFKWVISSLQKWHSFLCWILYSTSLLNSLFWLYYFLCRIKGEVNVDILSKNNSLTGYFPIFIPFFYDLTSDVLGFKWRMRLSHEVTVPSQTIAFLIIGPNKEEDSVWPAVYIERVMECYRDKLQITNFPKLSLKLFSR